MSSRKQINARVTISRNSQNRMNFRITDDDAVVHFCEFDMSMEDFAFAITGLAEMRVTAVVQGLQKVGLTRITEPAEVEVPDEIGSSRRDIESWLIANHQRPGWELRETLSSQSSIDYRNGKTIARFVYHMWIEKEVPA